MLKDEDDEEEDGQYEEDEELKSKKNENIWEKKQVFFDVELMMRGVHYSFGRFLGFGIPIFGIFS